MPSGVFKPYAGVSTSVLIFTKGEATKNVWFYQMQSDGFSLDDKRTKIGDGSGDIPDIIKSFENKKKEDNEDRTKKHFFVPVSEIVENSYDLSINKYKKEIETKINYRDSKLIIKETLKEVKELEKGLEELGKLVSK
jgi:type I restriction enzyme M protein